MKFNTFRASFARWSIHIHLCQRIRHFKSVLLFFRVLLFWLKNPSRNPSFWQHTAATPARWSCLVPMQSQWHRFPSKPSTRRTISPREINSLTHVRSCHVRAFTFLSFDFAEDFVLIDTRHWCMWRDRFTAHLTLAPSEHHFTCHHPHHCFLLSSSFEETFCSTAMQLKVRIKNNLCCWYGQSEWVKMSRTRWTSETSPIDTYRMSTSPHSIGSLQFNLDRLIQCKWTSHRFRVRRFRSDLMKCLEHTLHQKRRSIDIHLSRCWSIENISFFTFGSRQCSRPINFKRW